MVDWYSGFLAGRGIGRVGGLRTQKLRVKNVADSAAVHCA